MVSPLTSKGSYFYTLFSCGWADYNNARAAFKQQPGAGLGRVGPFEQIIGTQSGVCGDIHSMVAKFAQQRGWEAFTVGYALSGEQHVVTSVVDPKNPDKLMVVNYGRYEEAELNDGNSVRPVPTQSMTDLGMQMRIFKNDASNGGDGGMQQIATIPTPLGSFYQGGVRSFPIGNTLQSINLLQNFNQPDGPRLTIGQKFMNPSGRFSGSVSLWAGMSTSTVKPQNFGGIQVKINLGPKKK